MTDTEGNPTLASALNYARRGWYVFPCLAGLKVPTGGSEGWKDATTDETRIRAWWAENPRYNVAIATGPSGLFVVDVDPEGQEHWAGLLDSVEGLREAVKDAPRITTPRGGFHVYLTGEGRSTASKLAQGIDTRGSGGYVLAPPSYVSDGKSKGNYSVASGTLPCPPAPAALIERVARASVDAPTLPPEDVEWDSEDALGRAQAWLENLVLRDDVAVEGHGGDQRTYEVACKLLEMAIKPATAVTLLDTHWNPHCSPPWAFEDLQAKVMNAWRYGEETKGGKATLSLDKEHAHLLGAEGAAVGPDAELADIEAQMGKYLPVSLTEARKGLGAYNWLLPKLIPEKGVGLMYGPPGTYKTFLLLDLGLSLATGYGPNWFKDEQEPRDVIFLAGESSHAFKRERTDAWLAMHAIPGLDISRMYVMDRVPAFSIDGYWPIFRAWVKAKGLKPALIVVDTLSRAMAGMDENSARDAVKAVQQMEALADELNCFVLAVHHTTKPREGERASLRGSSVLTGNIDTSFEIVKDAKAEKSVHMFSRKQKEGESDGPPLAFKGEAYGEALAFTRDHDYAPPPPDKLTGKGSEEWMQAEFLADLLSGGPMTLEHLVESIAARYDVPKRTIRTGLKDGQKSRYRAWVPEGDVWRIPDTHPAKAVDIKETDF